ncbi:MAG: hypothetical protein KFH87_12565 [Bacteroidetes bacterium]|nr:hypothetical protein [Bacteroidota bacterium]
MSQPEGRTQFMILCFLTTAVLMHNMIRQGSGSWHRRAVLVFLPWILLFTDAQADGWSKRDTADTYLSTGVRGFSGQQYFGPEGEIVDVHRIQEQTIWLSSVHAYSKYVMGIVQIPVFRKLYVQESPEDRLLSVQSPGDVDLGLRLHLFPGSRHILHFTALFGIPLGEATQSDGLWAGDDEYNQLISLGYEYCFVAIPVHWTAEIGYDLRSAGYADELHLRAGLSVYPWERLRLGVKADLLSGQGNGNAAFTGGSFGFAGNNRRYLLYGAEAALLLTDGMGLNFGAYTVTNARNMPSSLFLTSGVFFLISPSGRR